MEGADRSQCGSQLQLVALLVTVVTVVVSCGVFGWCMRASRILICYHASLLKMFCNCRKFYDSRKSTTVACSACLCGEFGWCMRALHTLIGYHASILETMLVIVQTHQTQADVHSSGNH